MVAQGALGPQMGSLGLGAERAGSVAFPLGPDPFQLGLDPRDRLVTAGPVTLGLVGVVADDKPLVGAIQADFLDPQVVADPLVAALAGQGLVDQLASVAHAHPGDVVPACPA